MSRTPLLAIACMLVASILGAGGQYLYKAGTDRATTGGISMFGSPWILGGMACYVAVMFLFTQAFRAGGTVTVLYPVYALTFIWAAILGLVVFGQPIRPVHLLGMVLLVSGIYLMGIGNAAS
jgi:multidrug transporter EmrE-like cation transporter